MCFNVTIVEDNLEEGLLAERFGLNLMVLEGDVMPDISFLPLVLIQDSDGRCDYIMIGSMVCMSSLFKLSVESLLFPLRLYITSSLWTYYWSHLQGRICMWGGGGSILAGGRVWEGDVLHSA